MPSFQRFLLLVISMRLLFIGLICYYLWFVLTHHDFYFGIGLSDLSTHSYLLIVSGLGIIFSAILLWKKRIVAWKVYMGFKTLDLIIWALAIAPVLQTLSGAIPGLDRGIFAPVFSASVLIVHLIFMLSFYYYALKAKA